MPIPATLDTAQSLIDFMNQVWEPVDWPTYNRFQDATQTALAFGWVAAGPTDHGATIYARGFERVVIDDDGQGIALAD
jgi:hypothetical protein